MLTSADARRRRYGVCFLALAAGMLIGGTTALKPLLKGLAFLMYWGACFVFTGLAMITALLDVRAVRRDVYEEQRHLIKRMLDEPVTHMPRNNQRHPNPESFDRTPQ